MLYLIPAAAVLLAGILLVPAMRAGSTQNARRRVVLNGGAFLTATLTMVAMAVTASAAPAEPAAVAVVAATVSTGAGLGYLAAALSTGLACIGAGIAIGGAAPAAIGAFSEDPKAFGKALIFVVLGEGVALYGLLISILLITKL